MQNYTFLRLISIHFHTFLRLIFMQIHTFLRLLAKEQRSISLKFSNTITYLQSKEATDHSVASFLGFYYEII